MTAHEKHQRRALISRRMRAAKIGAAIREHHRKRREAFDGPDEDREEPLERLVGSLYAQ